MVEKLGIKDVLQRTSEADKLISGGDFVMLSEVTHLNFSQAAFQTEFLTFVFCMEGVATLRLDDDPITICAGDMLVVLNERTLTDIYPSSDFNGLIVVSSQEFFDESFVGMQHLWPYLLYIYANPVVHLNSEEVRMIRVLVEPLRVRREQTAYPFKSEVTLAFMRIFYYDVCFFLRQRQVMSDSNSHHNYAIFDKFVHLVQKNCREVRTVEWYAQQMFITPKYLSDVVKKVSGRTARRWIANFVVLEIKNLLRTTNWSMKQISLEMHFPNQSFMGKYFKKMSGMSLSKYRNNL